MGIPLLVKRHLYIETDCRLWGVFCDFFFVKYWSCHKTLHQFVYSRHSTHQTLTSLNTHPNSPKRAIYGVFFVSTDMCRYSAITFVTVLHSALPWQWQNETQTLDPQNTPHNSPSRTSYGVSFVMILENWPLYTCTALYFDLFEVDSFEDDEFIFRIACTNSRTISYKVGMAAISDTDDIILWPAWPK